VGRWEGGVRRSAQLDLIAESEAQRLELEQPRRLGGEARVEADGEPGHAVHTCGAEQRQQRPAAQLYSGVGLDMQRRWRMSQLCSGVRSVGKAVACTLSR
jgi:hypothetical protein